MVASAIARRVTNRAPGRALSLLGLPRPLVIAHRGFCHAAPENTLAAFRLAAATHADAIELDYHESSDGVPMVLHDHHLGRTTNAVAQWGRKHLLVHQHTAARIQSLNAGQWFSPDFAHEHPRSLREVLVWARQNRRVLVIERKTGSAETCARLLRETRMQRRVFVQSFDWQFLLHLHELSSEVLLGALGPPHRLAHGARAKVWLRKFANHWLDLLPNKGIQVVVWSKKLSPAAINSIHSRGLKVWTYTVNTAADAQRLIKAGANGLITNDPPLIWKTLALLPKESDTSPLPNR